MARGRDQLGRPPRKRIERHTDAELDMAITYAISRCAVRGLDFYAILHGVDAYQERRRRLDRAAARKESALADALDPRDAEAMWGDS